MWHSLRISHLCLRVSLAAVFLWFGVDKFFHPLYWLNAWVPQMMLNLIGTLHLSGNTLIYGLGVVELLIGISLASNMFVELFSLVGAALLVAISLFYGLNEVLIRDVGLIGGLLALAFWPHRTFRNR